MYTPYSLLASATLLSFSTFAEARAAQQNAAQVNEPKPFALLPRWPWNRLFGKNQEDEPFTELDCPTDDLYIEILDSAPSTAVQTFCNRFLDIPPATVTVTYNATLTSFTSANATSTQTIQVLTTSTVTATITPAAVQRRAADMVAQLAVANSIFTDVVTEGTAAIATTAARNANREAALTGFDNACSCERVAPLSTVTVTDLITAQSILTTTTVTPLAGESGNASGSQPSGAVNATLIASIPVPASITGAPSASLIASGSVAPISSPSASAIEGPPVVIGIPFECPQGANANPKADGLNPHFIVGDLRYEYSVLCNTAIDQSGPLTTIERIANQTACAAECSLINNVSQRQLCQSASFVPNDGATDGTCHIHGPATRFVSRPGSTSILLTGVSSKADKCQSADLVNGPGNSTADIAQLVDNALASGFSMSTPGLVTRSQTGGVYKTFYSSGYTRSDGFYFYSWFEIYASSSAWWAAYATSWSCTVKAAPKTIIIPQPVENRTSVFVDVTTIVNGSITTIISGTSTFSRTEGGGAISPSPVLASATSGGISLVTGFSTINTNATAGAAAEGSVPTVVASGTSILPSASNQTASAGSAWFTVAGSDDVANSIGGGGFEGPAPTVVASGPSILPSAGNQTVSAGSGVLTASAANAVNQTASAGSAGFTASASGAVTNSTGGSGLEGIVPTAGSNNFTIIEGLSTGFSVGGGGSIAPSAIPSSVAGSLSAVGANVTLSTANYGGAASATSSPFVIPNFGYGKPSSSAAANSQPASFAVASAIPPPLVTAVGPIASSNATFNSANITLSGTGAASAGSAEVSAAGSAGVILSTGGTGVGSLLPIPVNSTQAPFGTVSSAEIPLSTGTGSNGELNFTLSGGGAVTSSIGGFGVIPPSQSPIPSANVTSPVGTGSVNVPPASANVSISVSVGVPSEVGSSGAVPPPSVNASQPISVTASASVPLPSSNATLPSGSEGFTVSSETAVSSLASGNGIIPPVNSTAVIGTAPISSGALNISLSGSASVILSTGTGGVVPPVANLTTSAPASLTPSPTANSTVPNGDEFSNSGRDRTGGFRRPSSVGNRPPVGTAPGTISPLLSVNATVPVGTAPVATISPVPIVNVTLPAGTAPVATISPVPIVNVTVPVGTAPIGPASVGTISPLPIVNVTVPIVSVGNTTIPLVTAPIGTISPVPVINSTVIPIPVVNSTSLPPVVVIPGIGYLQSTSSAASTSAPSALVALVSANSSALVPTAAASISIPALSANSSAIVPTAAASISIPILSANSSDLVPTAGASVSIPALSANSSALVPTVGASVSVPAISANSSAIVPTAGGSVSIAVVSANSSAAFPTASGSVTVPPLSLNSTAILPTASGSSGPDFSNSEGDRLGRSRSRSSSVSASVPAPSTNVTLPSANVTLPGTAPVSIPLSTGVSLNSTQLPVGTASLSIPPRSNITIASSSLPLPSVNSSIRATRPSAGPRLSANFFSIQLVTASTGTAPSASLPTGSNFTNSEVNRSGVFSRPAGNSTAFLPTGTAPASSIEVPFNTSQIIGTGTGTGSVSIPLSTAAGVGTTGSGNGTIPLPTGSLNATLPLGTGTGAVTVGSTGFPVSSLNSTFAPLLATSAPAITPSPNLNSSEADCPTPTPSLIPHTIVITTVSYETLLAEPTCAPTVSGLAYRNASLALSGTGTSAPISLPLSTAPTTARTRRRAGELATQDQINAACADRTNLVDDATFAANDTAAWTITPDDAAISLRFINTPSGSRAARIAAAAAGRSLTLSQPLTLCPGKQYRLTSYNRQANLLSKCTAEYSVGDSTIFTASPQETLLKREAFFTAGEGATGASKDLKVRWKCDGEGGIAAGTDAEGYMNAEVASVAVVLA